MQQTLYLASGSPRRLEILSSLGFAVVRVAAAIDETPLPAETAEAYVRRLALEKNRAAQALCRPPQWSADTPLLSADTSVALNGQILGKPESAGQAAEMLQALSGKVHQVLTAVCVSRRGQEALAVQQSDVHFKTLSAAEIDAYVRSGEPMDKAGAYGIQGLGGLFVAHLSGSFTGVMGLPVYETAALLAQLDVPVPALAKG